MSDPADITTDRPDVHGDVAAGFRARMFPLAAVVGLLVAILPPASYAVNARARLTSDAARHAEQVAAEIERVASRQPDLWPYNLPKVVQALAHIRDTASVAQVTVLDCDGSIRFDSESLGFPVPRADDVVARLPVHAARGVVAWVDVGVSSRAERASLRVWTVSSTLLGSLLAAVLFVFPTRAVYASARRIARANRELAEAHAALADANRDLERRVDEARDRLRAVARDAVAVQEEERARVARDLHDSLGQHLAAQRFALDQLAAAGRADEVAPLREINAALFDDLRRAIHDLGPAELEQGALGDAIRARCESFELRSGLLVSARVDADTAIDPRVARAMVRVLEEALTNAVRHADATEVGVVCSVADGRVSLEVTDDGRGWPHGSPPVGAGAGLEGMRTRMDLVGGTLELGTTESGGAFVRAIAPAHLPGLER